MRAELAPDPEEPVVERAWARIDGSVRFLVRFGNDRMSVTKHVEYCRLGGAPWYAVWHLSWASHEEYSKVSALAEVAAVRFERKHEPETYNLYNNWDIVQAHRREGNQSWDEESYQRERIKEDRKKLSDRLKLARSAPEKLPKVLLCVLSNARRNFWCDLAGAWSGSSATLFTHRAASLQVLFGWSFIGGVAMRKSG